MGQTSLQILNRTGSKSFWNSSWDNKYLYQDFFFKFLLFERIVHTIINKKSYSSEVLSLTFKTINNIYIFKNFKETVNTNDEDDELYNEDICKSKLWVFKYHNWVVLSVFILMPYKHHKLVKKNLTLVEPYMKKKLFRITSLKKTKLPTSKPSGMSKIRALKSATRLKKRSSLKISPKKKAKLKKKKLLIFNTANDIKCNLTLYVKNSYWLKNFSGNKLIKKIKVKKLTPLNYYKDSLKKTLMAIKRKIKASYDITKGMFKRKKLKKKKDKSITKTPFKTRLLKRKRHTLNKFFRKNKYSIPKLRFNIKTKISPRAKFLRKFVYLKWSLLDYKKKAFKLISKRRLKSKLSKKFFLYTESFNKTNKVLSYKNSYFKVDALNNSALAKKKFFKKRILFYKLNKKSNKKLSKKSVFEKSFLLNLSILSRSAYPRIKFLKLNSINKKTNLKKIYNVLDKKNNKARESEALIRKTISIKNLYNYL